MSRRNNFVPAKYVDEEWVLWWKLFHQKKAFFNNFKDTKGDLFLSPRHFALAHCVSSDFKMSKGIAATFKQRYGGVEQLLRQNQRPGGLAFIKRDERLIFYLLTKKKYFKKPDYRTIFRSLSKLRDFICENDIWNLAVPRLCCGRDRKNWKVIKPMISFLFRNTKCLLHFYE